MHTISFSSTAVSKEDHYRSILLPPSFKSASETLEQRNSPSPSVRALSDFENLMKYLPEPVPIQSILSELRDNFINFPQAMLGEVGLDKVFKLPFGKKGWTREIENNPKSDEDDGSAQSANPHTLALRHHKLSSLTPSMSHQVEILRFQLSLAVEFKRNVSLHCVKASGALTQCLEDERAKHGSDWYDISECSPFFKKLWCLFPAGSLSAAHH